VKTYELRGKTKSELISTLDELKRELSELRTSKVVGGTATKLGKIGFVRKSIARVLTVFNQTTKSKLREKYAGETHVPRDLRAKQTRAIRRRLTDEQQNKKTVKQTKREANFPKRKYAVKAL
ncbi:unnamed protein product, partial [Ectocarpus fasciculatus]